MRPPIDIKSWIHAGLFLIGRDLKWNVTCTQGGFGASSEVVLLGRES